MDGVRHGISTLDFVLVVLGVSGNFCSIIVGPEYNAKEVTGKYLEATTLIILGDRDIPW